MKRLVMFLVAGLVALGLAHASASAATILAIDQNVLANNSNVFGGATQFTIGSGTADLSFNIDKVSGPNFSFVATVCSTTACSTYDPLHPPANFVVGTTGTNSSSGLFSFAGLGAGSYYFNILYTTASAVATAIHYTFTVATAAVTPIPPALLMFVTALGGLGGLGFWRRRSFPGGSAMAA